MSRQIRSLRQWWAHRQFYRRNKQQEQDTLDLFWLTSFHKNFHKRLALDPNFGEDLNSDQINDMCYTQLSQELSHIERKVRVISELDDQVVKIMENVVSRGGSNPYPCPVLKNDPNKNKKLQAKGKGKSETVQISDYEAFKMDEFHVKHFEPGKPEKHHEGFTLQIKKSNIEDPESGYGVFVEGVVIPGTVLAFYPGVIHFPETLDKTFIEGNAYMITRYDNCVIDGWRWSAMAHNQTYNAALMAHATGKQSDQNTNLKKFRNPFGIGNYINHPPKLTQPNVLNFAYDFPSNTKEQYLPYVPNIYFKEPGFLYFSDTAMRTVVIVAKRRIENEELFMNYRYNPAHPYPNWYWQPDEEEAKRRWSRRTFL